LKDFEGKPSGSNFGLPGGFLTILGLNIFFVPLVDVLGSDVS